MTLLCCSLHVYIVNTARFFLCDGIGKRGLTFLFQSILVGYKVLALLDVAEKNQEEADVYIHVTYIKKWDICAGNAVLRALGGHMTTLNGEEISYTGSDGNEGGLIASINMNHKALIEKLPDLEETSHKLD